VTSVRWRHAFRFLPVILLFVAALSPLAGAQDRPRNEFGIWGAYSTNSAYLFGSYGRGQLGVVAFRYARILSAATRPYTLSYTIDISPVDVVRQPLWRSCSFQQGGVTTQGYCPFGGETVYGGGANPIGLKLNLLPQHRWQPFIAASCGQITFLRPVPVDLRVDTQFNFTAEGQLGYEHFNSARTHSWRFGYKFQHISDGGRGDINPGFNLNELFVGYSFFK
jgi:Lipid A 3-O-deacylase (PagL)